MKQIAGILALCILLAACQKEDSELLVKSATNGEELNGRYLGTFNRDGKTTQVSILFKPDGTYDGSSSNDRFPAICSGTYTRDGSTLTINDMCSWSADFDWTLIFDGTYMIEDKGGESIRIWRSNGTFTDEYLLGKATK